MKLVDWRTTSKDIKDSGVDTAIINIGSIEQHGAHLPVGTDYIIGHHVARGVAERIGAYLLPSFAVGNCQEHMGRAGSVWMKPETLFALLKDVCGSLKMQGFKRIAILLSHGGLWVVKPAVREINLNNPDLTVIWTDTYSHSADTRHRAILEGTLVDLHAGEGETSLILYLDPETVKMERAVDYDPKVGREYLDYAPCGKVCPDGVWGSATLGTAEKGKELFEIMVDTVSKYCQETFDQVEELKRRQL